MNTPATTPAYPDRPYDRERQYQRDPATMVCSNCHQVSTAHYYASGRYWCPRRTP